MVLVKFLEKNCRKGRFRPSKLKGKRVIELGAGCGVAGFGMALLGCDVVSTDQTEVLPLLIRNVERNTSRVTQMNPDSDSFGSIKVAELNWGDEDQIKAVEPPFDYIIGTDVVYAEHLLEPLLQTILALSGPKTTILLGYEIRSTNVHEKMLELWKRNFEVKTVPKAKNIRMANLSVVCCHTVNGVSREQHLETLKKRVFKMFVQKSIAAIAIIAMLCGFAYADVISVEWGLDMNGWPNGKKFKAGDVLEFNYDTNYQDVWIVNKQNYDSCTPSGTRLNSGHDYVILARRTTYFISGYPGMCAVEEVKAEVIAE